MWYVSEGTTIQVMNGLRGTPGESAIVRMPQSANKVRKHISKILMKGVLVLLLLGVVRTGDFSYAYGATGFLCLRGNIMALTSPKQLTKAVSRRPTTEP